jgi:uncharacterized membrane protein
MIALSDSVFAIVLTLLVLDLRMPPSATDANLFPSIAAMEPKFTAFAITFALVSVFWIAHLSIIRRLLAFDWPAAWANLAFLFTIAITPFASTLLGGYSVLGDAWRVYCLVLIAIGVAQAVLLIVIYRDGGRLVGGVTAREFWHRLIRAISPGAAFAVALALSLMGERGLSVAVTFVLVPVILIAARWILGERRPTAVAVPPVEPAIP